MTGFPNILILIVLLISIIPIKTQSNDTSNNTVNITSSFYYCGEEDNQCQNKELICNFEYGSCQIYCQTERSCENTTITLGPNPSWLNVYCNANESCINAQITELGTLTAIGENTLNGTTITCQDGKGCTVSCQDTLSCSNSVIDGKSSGSLNVECKKHQSCLDMTIKCPPGAKNAAYCSITGTKGNQVTVHNAFSIHAPNGWGDIKFIDYTAYTLSGKMRCGGNNSFLLPTNERYSCDIQYGIWDCKNISSPCSNQTWLALDTEYHICDGIGIDSCNDREIECQDPTELQYAHWPGCNLLCIGDNTCQNTLFICNHQKKCDIICSGQGSCNGLRVRGSIRDTGERFMNNPMNIICGRDGNNGACQNSNFSAPYRITYPFQFNIHAFGTNNLLGTEIYGPPLYGRPLYVQCNFNQSCQGAYIYDAFFSSSELVIQCNGEYDSCADMTVYCPDNDLCVIKGDSIDRNTGLNLFCKNGWDDIDISQWNNAQILYTIDDGPSRNDTITTTIPPAINTTTTPSFNVTDLPSLNVTTLPPSNTTNNATNSTLAPAPNSTFPFPVFNDTIDTTFVPIDNETLFNLNIIHCGDDYDYQCEIDDNFNCTCPPITTSSQPTMSSNDTDSIEPTPKPSLSPLVPGVTRTPTKNDQGINGTNTTTPSPTGAENIDEWFIIGVTFIVLFGVVACILAYFAWIFHRADDKATKGGYHKTDQNEEIEAGNLNQTH